MGTTKIEQQSSGTQTATPTAEEKRLNQLQLEQMEIRALHLGHILMILELMFQ